MLMICNKAGKTSGCAVCPESKPHEPTPRNPPRGAKILKMMCMGERTLVEVKLIPAAG